MHDFATASFFPGRFFYFFAFFNSLAPPMGGDSPRKEFCA
jgi:hypothetical protein